MSARDDIVHRWLGEALGGRELHLEAASQDASFRRYLRAHAGGRSWIVMDAPPEHEDCGPFLDVARRLQAAGVHVPQVVAAAPELGVLLLEDLGDRRYLDCLDGEDGAERLYADAIAALLTMQAATGCEGLPEYDRAELLREMRLFDEWFLQRYLGIDLGRHHRAALQAAYAFLAEAALAQPRVFVHRDYHCRNLMVCPGHNPGVLDFQDALHGPVTYDLVSLLRDAYVRWPEARVEAWVEAYHALAIQHGVLPDGDDEAAFRRDFDLMGVQRHLKVAGIFARLWLRDGKRGYLGDIARVLGYLVDVAGRYPELRALQDSFLELALGERLRAANAAAGVIG